MVSLKHYMLRLIICSTVLLIGKAGVAQLFVESDSLTPWWQRNDSLLEQVNLNQMETNYLLERTLNRVDPSVYGPTSGSPAADRYDWQDIYHTFLTCQTRDTGLLDPWDSVETRVAAHLAAGNIPIGIIHWEYDRINPNAFTQGLLTTDQSGQYLVQTGMASPFIKQSCFFAAPLRKSSWSGTVNFVLASDLFHESHIDGIDQVEIDFDDGQGWRNIVFDIPVPVVYTVYGWKNIRIRVTTSSGNQVHGNTTFKNKRNKYTWSSPTDGFSQEVEAETPYQGVKGKALVTFRFGCGDGKLRKPLIIVPGISFPILAEAFDEDPENDFESFRTNLLADHPSFYYALENHGYDLVYVEYEDGSDFIQRNARVVETVIKMVNDMKAQNGSDEPNVMLGISMGGVVGRYALLEMESGGHMHDVEKFYSLDAPHYGANLPLAAQSAVDHIANINVYFYLYIGPYVVIQNIPMKNLSSKIGVVEDAALAPATQQLILSSLQSGSGIGESAERITLNNELSAMGEFPSQVSSRGIQIRNYALSNGACDGGTGQPYAPNSNLADIEAWGFVGDFLPIPNANAILFAGLYSNLELNTVPDPSQGTRLIYQGTVVNFSFVGVPGAAGVGTAILSYKRNRVNGTASLDNAPGGDIVFPDPNDYIPSLPFVSVNVTLHQDAICFIPSVSSCALKSPYRNNLNYPILSNWDDLTKTWSNGESYMDDFQWQEEDDGSGNIVPVNTYHTDWTPLNQVFFKESFADLPDALLTYTSGSVELINHTYNMGQGTPKRINFIKIRTGGVLGINANMSLGNTPNGNNPAPVPGSHFEVYTSGSTCYPVIGVEIQSDGLLQVGDNSSQNTGELLITDNAKLEIRNGGVLRIADNSKVVIDASSRLVFHPGASIYLDGENAVLEIHGELQIMNGATFTFTKSPGFTGGFIRFDMSDPNAGIFSQGTNGKISLSGNNIPGLLMDKVLEVINGTLSTPDNTLSATDYLAEFNIVGGMVAVGSGSRLKVSVTSDFQYTYFVGLVSRSTNTGLWLPKPHLANIFQCSFRDLDKGIDMDMSTFVSKPSLSYCSFKNNYIGLSSDYGGLGLYNCTFTGNSVGWWSTLQNQNSEIRQSGFSNNDFGIIISNASPVETYLEEVSFTHNETGILSEQTANSIDLTAACCLFSYNELTGLDFHGSGRLNLSTAYAPNGNYGGNCAFFNNGTAINLYETQPYLEDGDNVFRNTGIYASNLFMTGVMPDNCGGGMCSFYTGVAPTPYAVKASGNYWDPGISSDLWVSTFPHWTQSQLSGSVHPSFTSTCFYEETNGVPAFIDGWPGPQLKRAPDDSTTSVSVAGERNGFRMYPNPAVNTFTVEMDEPFASDFSLELTDMTGKAVAIRTESLSDRKVQVKVSDLSPGVYLVHVHSNGRYHNRRIILSP